MRYFVYLFCCFLGAISITASEKTNGQHFVLSNQDRQTALERLQRLQESVEQLPDGLTKDQKIRIITANRKMLGGQVTKKVHQDSLPE